MNLIGLNIGLRYAGMKKIATPPYQIGFKHLHLPFYNSSSTENLKLKGKLVVDKRGAPYLTLELDNTNPIYLSFGNNEYTKLIGKYVTAIGKKSFINGQDYLKRLIKDNKYFKVEQIYEEESQLKNEWPVPVIEKIDDYLPYFTSSQKEEPIEAFLLSLIGTNEPNQKVGVGLLTHIPKELHPKNAEPIIKMYKRLDPFQNINGNTDRLSIAGLAEEEHEPIITRKAKQSEIDYLLAERPYTTDRITRRLLTNNAELFTVIGEDGLNNGDYYSGVNPYFGQSVRTNYAVTSFNTDCSNSAGGL
ncbi:MAG: hypothetical protein HY544_04370 [Candidatus Diapherotrites archaeon]|uniref:Uncharacterized protein n=1 Tax=Candidatus Iainarchaeum sp. TaxID=3101447 RepID=A0A8T3YPN8_9ARCH|nr:hypothetical protein [Candidatus Diapherotrites archaeon]